nr:OmpA family protein [Micromonospora sp. DSM 115978]
GEAPDQTVSVVGHTADDGSGPDSGGPLSTRRAEVVRDLLVEMGLPASSIRDVRGVGAREPLVQPPDSPANRTVVVTVTTTTTG